MILRARAISSAAAWGRVGGIDLPRMDQRLAVEAHVASLRALFGKTGDIVDVVVKTTEISMLPAARAARMQWVNSGNIAARPGSIRIQCFAQYR
jgi:hypothetical protein